MTASSSELRWQKPFQSNAWYADRIVYEANVLAHPF